MRIAKEDSMGNNIEIKKSPAMRAYGYLTMDEFFGNFEASLKTAKIQRDSSPRNYAEVIPKFFEEISKKTRP